MFAVDADVSTHPNLAFRLWLVQLERIGFFVVDKDTTPELLVLNRTVTLREAPGKGTAPTGKSRKEEQASVML